MLLNKGKLELRVILLNLSDAADDSDELECST